MTHIENKFLSYSTSIGALKLKMGSTLGKIKSEIPFPF